MLKLILDINLFSFIFGVLVALFVMVLMRRRKSLEKDVDETVCEDSRFYLNIFFLNRKEIVENMVRSKVDRKKVLVRALAKRFAVKVVTDEKLISKVAQDLVVVIPTKLELQGIVSNASVVYQQGSFLCIEVNITAVDFLKITERQGSAEKADKIRQFLTSFGLPNLITFINTQLVRVAAKKVMTSLPSTIISKLQDKLTADLDVVCLNDAEQGPFLCQTLQSLNKEADEEKEKD